VELEFAGVGGISKRLRTKSYSLDIVPIAGQKRKIQAIGVPKINNGDGPFNKTVLAELFGISEETINRDPGQIDILIGVDHVAFHTGVPLFLSYL